MSLCSQYCLNLYLNIAMLNNSRHIFKLNNIYKLIVTYTNILHNVNATQRIFTKYFQLISYNFIFNF